LKRSSNRLVLLVGIFLAVVSFGGIMLLLSSNPPPQALEADPLKKVVIAKEDLVLGTLIRENQLELVDKPTSTVVDGAFNDISQVAGKTVRWGLGLGGQVTKQVTEGSPGQIEELQVPAGKVAIAVQVDQVTGVGTVINEGDYVDVIVGFTGDKFPVVTLDPATETLTVVAGLNSTSVKALIQGAQVLGTLLPPPPAAPQGGEQAPPPDGTGTSLTGQQQIVILAVTTKQAEVIKFAQLDGTISLVLRSSKDFTDPTTNEPIEGPIADAPGVVLKSLVDEYGVLVPELVEAVLPTLQGN
jgi:pilus assembly protein CpaB